MTTDCHAPEEDVTSLQTCFSACRVYRYCLHRTVSPSGTGAVTFIMLNPSTADERNDDPTIRRCMGFARDWGFRDLYVVNLSPYRSPSPRHLKAMGDEPREVQATNCRFVLRALRTAQLTVAAWGVHGVLGARDRHMLQTIALDGRHQVHCLGTTRDGHPRHPLYLPRSVQPIKYELRCCTRA